MFDRKRHYFIISCVKGQTIGRNIIYAREGGQWSFLEMLNIYLLLRYNILSIVCKIVTLIINKRALFAL